MSLIVSSAISDMRLECGILGQKISDADFMLYLNRVNKHFMSNYKMPTTERQADLLVFNGVYEYALPSDFAGIMPPRKPYGNQSPDFYHETPRSVARYLSGKKTAIKFDRETPFLVVQDDEGGSVQVHDCESLTENGTWSVSGDASSLALDSQIFEQGSHSLRFAVTASGGNTTLTNSTLSTAVDITDYLTAGWVFLDPQCPSGNSTALTSVRLRLGSDSSNYYEVSATTRQRGNTILGGWGIIGFNLSTKTTTGTPTNTAINYIQVFINHGTSGINGTYRLDNIFLALPTYYQLPYYSNQNVKSNGGAYQTAVTTTDDTILVPFEFDEAYTYGALEIAAIEKLKDAGLITHFREKFTPIEKALKSRYPSQQSNSQFLYYHRANKF